MKYSLALLSLLVSLSGSAQTQLTDNYFPVAGDTLRTLFADSSWVATLDFKFAGGMNLEWDFRDPVSTGANIATVAAADVEPFPLADIVITNALFNQNYFRNTGAAFELVGTSTRLELLPDFAFETAVDPAIPERRTGVSIGERYSTGFSIVNTISPDSLPAEALALLPEGSLTFVDSIRFTIQTTREDAFDASGTVRLGENYYPVIREKRLQSANIKVEVRVPFFGYRDIADFLGDDAGGLGELLGPQDTVVTYLWWNNDSKEPIVEVQTDLDLEVLSMQYKRALESTSTGGPRSTQARIMLYPNPTTDYFNYSLENVPPGEYKLAVVNTLGRRLASRQFTAFTGQTVLEVDVSHFPAGAYVATLRNARGLSISTRKFLVR